MNCPTCTSEAPIDNCICDQCGFDFRTIGMPLLGTHKHAADEVQKRKPILIQCWRCKHQNIFAHTIFPQCGFADTLYFYSDSGHYTVLWNLFDSIPKHLQELIGVDITKDAGTMQHLEDMLPLAPDGGRYRFTNRARCLACPQVISESILETE